MGKRGQVRTYHCSVCGDNILRRTSHLYKNSRYCNQCWDEYQTVWRISIENWVKSHGKNIKSLDIYPDLKGKGYYATSDGNIWSTRYVYKPKKAKKFKTWYLPKPIKYSVPIDKPIFHYGGDRKGMLIKDIIYTLFVDSFDSKNYIIVNKDYDIFNNSVENLVRFPRNAYLHNTIYYAVKNGRRIAESSSVQGLARIVGLNEYVVRKLIRTGKKTKHGIYLKKERPF